MVTFKKSASDYEFLKKIVDHTESLLFGDAFVDHVFGGLYADLCRHFIGKGHHLTPADYQFIRKKVRALKLTVSKGGTQCLVYMDTDRKKIFVKKIWVDAAEQTGSRSIASKRHIFVGVVKMLYEIGHCVVLAFIKHIRTSSSSRKAIDRTPVKVGTKVCKDEDGKQQRIGDAGYYVEQYATGGRVFLLDPARNLDFEAEGLLLERPRADRVISDDFIKSIQWKNAKRASATFLTLPVNHLTKPVQGFQEEAGRYGAEQDDGVRSPRSADTCVMRYPTSLRKRKMRSEVGLEDSDFGMCKFTLAAIIFCSDSRHLLPLNARPSLDCPLTVLKSTKSPPLFVKIIWPRPVKLERIYHALATAT